MYIVIIMPINISPHIVTFVCVMRAPEIYILNKFPVFNTVISNYRHLAKHRSLDLLILCNYFISLDQHLPISPTSPFLVTSL